MSCSLILLDDEPLALSLLENYVLKKKDWELKASFNDAQFALDYIQKHPVDLIISDINMPDISGIEMVEQLKKISKTLVIFITAYKEHAIQSYELDVIDYIVKPVSFSRFEKALAKAREQIILRSGFEEGQKDAKPSFIYVFSEYQQVKIDVSEIVYLQSMGDYVKIFLAKVPKPIITLERIKNFEESLGPKGFIRIHRSYMVNTEYVVSFSRTKLMAENTWLPISQSQLAITIAALKQK
ncbi:MAG: response regulator transcription factor [Saprospiraceae bacterium]|nr:response regulator transcription factor [Saprospiraceae bacterium]